MTLPGPSRKIIVKPIERPVPAQPKREPAKRERQPQQEPEPQREPKPRRRERQPQPA
jgi:hypothetical protein